MKNPGYTNGVAHTITGINPVQARKTPLIHQQGIICGVAFDRSSLRRIAPYASVVAPRRLASNILLVIRNTT